MESHPLVVVLLEMQANEELQVPVTDLILETKKNS